MAKTTKHKKEQRTHKEKTTGSAAVEEKHAAPIIQEYPAVRATRVQFKRLEVVALVIGIFLLGVIVGSMLLPPRSIDKDTRPSVSLAGEQTVEMMLPAVDAQGNGVVGTLQTTVRPGSGLVLVNVNNVLSNVDTQLAGRVAAEAAGTYENISLAHIDVIYNIEVNASIIEGPSAGAAMAVSIVYDLEKKMPNASIFITGTIEKDGTIGPIGGIAAKAQATKMAGGTVLLVPASSVQDVQSERVRKCSVIGARRMCTIVYQPLENTTYQGIEIRSVQTLGDAVRAFLEV